MLEDPIALRGEGGGDCRGDGTVDRVTRLRPVDRDHLDAVAAVGEYRRLGHGARSLSTVYARR
jgi:hypothetical protein